MATAPAPETGAPQTEQTQPAEKEKALKYIQFDTSSFIARLTLNHPPHNVLVVPLMVEMAEAIESLNGRGDIKAILLESSQKTFSEGIGVGETKADRAFQKGGAVKPHLKAPKENHQSANRGGEEQSH